MKTAFIYAIVLFVVFYAKNIWIYRYIIKCFKLVSIDKAITNKFLFKKNGKKVKNPRVSFLGVLYFYIIIPPDIPLKFIENWLNAQFVIINDMFMSMDLTGVVKASRREFTEEMDDKNYADGISYRYLVKFHPVFWFSRPRKFLLFIITFIISWAFIVKYGVIEYITIENMNMILSHIKDFFSVNQ